MPATSEAKLLASLSPKVKKPLEAALEIAPATVAEGLAQQGLKYQKAWSLAEAALEAAGFESEDDGLPLASKLTKEQRALAEIFAGRPGFSLYMPLLPKLAYWRRRWLGLEAPGALERANTKGVPLWKELAAAEDKDDDVLVKRKLPLEDRLQIWWDISCDAYNLGFDYGDIEWGKPSELKGKQPKVVAVATRCLDQLAASEAEGGWLRGGNDPHHMWSWPFFKALWAAKAPLKTEWEQFLPGRPNEAYTGPESVEQRKIWKELVSRIPEERRAAAIIASLGAFTSTRIGVGTQILAEFPLRAVADFVIAELPRADGPTTKIKARLKALGFDATKTPLAFVVTKRKKPKKVAELSAVEKKQLEAAGKAYDGKKLSAEMRLSTAKKDGETSFAGLFEIRDVADKKTKKPIYTVLLYRADSGSVFKAGSAKEVAGISQGSLECADAALREALLEVTS